jgi:uncharacterized damage-inducible protein DinB
MTAELDGYLQRIDDLRGQVRSLLTQTPSEALNWRPLEVSGAAATNSLAVLASHIAGAERFWISEVVGGLPPVRDRDAEFEVEVSSASELLHVLEEVGESTRRVFEGLREDDLGAARHVRGRDVPVRWGIVHVIDHTALHLGHMQLTYQLWIGGKTAPSPRWYERLKTGD